MIRLYSVAQYTIQQIFSVIPEAQLIELLIKAGYKSAKKAVQAIVKKTTGLEFLEEVGESGEKVYAIVYKGVKLEDGSFEVVEHFIKKVFESKSYTKYLDEILEITLKRRAALAKWSSKFEKKFHKHFDGEIVPVPHNDGTIAYYRMVGAHNHAEIGRIFDLIEPLKKPVGFSFDNLPNDVPFKANVKMTVEGKEYIKKSTSTFFPKNWDIVRVKEEVALVYEQMIKENFKLRFNNNKYKCLNSDGAFEIQVEIDKFGNITNSYPLIN